MLPSNLKFPVCGRVALVFHAPALSENTYRVLVQTIFGFQEFTITAVVRTTPPMEGETFQLLLLDSANWVWQVTQAVFIGARRFVIHKRSDAMYAPREVPFHEFSYVFNPYIPLKGTV